MTLAVVRTRPATLEALVLADRPLWCTDSAGASGVMRDLTGNGNHGTVTLGAGARNAAPLTHGG